MAFFCGEEPRNINNDDEFGNGDYSISKLEGQALTGSPAWKFSSDVATNLMTEKVVFLHHKCMQWEDENLIYFNGKAEGRVFRFAFFSFL